MGIALESVHEVDRVVDGRTEDDSADHHIGRINPYARPTHQAAGHIETETGSLEARGPVGIV